MSNFPDKYIIISSAYNEESNIELTIKSVLKQTIKPIEWIIIDDGSTDLTGLIIERYVKCNSFIKLVKSKKSDVVFGEHVAYNFNIALNSISSSNFNFIVKLDTDLSIDNINFFETQFAAFNSNKKLGITSGITYSIENGKKVLNSKRPYWRTGGAMKVYRRKCFEQIGGIQPIYGWDGLDEYLAMFYGWKTRTFFDLHVNHLGKKRALERDKLFKQYLHKGVSYYQRGYPIEFLLFKAMKLSTKKYLFWL